MPPSPTPTPPPAPSPTPTPTPTPPPSPEPTPSPPPVPSPSSSPTPTPTPTRRTYTLTAENVERIYDQCLAAPGDDTIPVKGVIHEASFSRAAIVTCHGAIVNLLAGLPDEYRADYGGGWTFLNACYDLDGNQWTSFHVVMEKLFMLGMAANLVTEMLPRELWDSLPGGMPYYAVNL